MLFGRRENSYKSQYSESQFPAFFPLTKQNVKKEILKGTDSNFSTKLNHNYQSNGKFNKTKTKTKTLTKTKTKTHTINQQLHKNIHIIQTKLQPK